MAWRFLDERDVDDEESRRLFVLLDEVNELFETAAVDEEEPSFDDERLVDLESREEMEDEKVLDVLEDDE